MHLDLRTCSQARLTRDPRFDGRFFIGVRSTRIYCRPICPVRTVKEQNVRYFPTAAAAREAGFRPCLRCRPELSPGTPAWCGSSTTVSRALRLISETQPEDQPVEKLAARLGIGSRQLRRLFVRHLGASPNAVMKTHRLHFAKKLIDETTLPMAEIALASGFGSVRRFNEAFRQTFTRTPTQIRRLSGAAAPQAKDEYFFRLSFRPPFNWDRLLFYLAQRAIVGVEEVTTNSYARTISLDGQSGTIRASLAKDGLAIEVRICFPETRCLFVITERLRRLFDLGSNPLEISAVLAGDSLLADRVNGAPGIRVPGCWDGFELSVRTILGQQVSVAAANTLAGRLVRMLGTKTNGSEALSYLFPKPEIVAEANLVRIGLPKKRAAAIQALARAVADARLTFEFTRNVEDFHSRLCELPGVGSWTAQYIAMRAVGDPDAFPASDLGLLRNGSFGSAAELTKHAENWRPWRAYAAMYLWQGDSNSESTAN